MLLKDGFSTDQQMGELSVTECGKTEVFPTYTCAHCNDIIIMRPDRVRPRQRCFKCFKMICGTKDICTVDCTPLYEMSRDHYEGAGDWAKWVNAIMAGEVDTSVAREKGLVF